MSGIQDPFTRLLIALGPFLEEVVIIGGWAYRLYYLHPAAQQLDYPPLMTLDTDVALPLSLTPGECDLRARLLSHGFTEQFFGDDRPPTTHYHLDDETSGFYVEFLTPLAGSQYDRRRSRKATMQIGGVTSQRLRYIDLLLHQPWSVDLEAGGVAAHVRVANPVSFIAQKVLIHAERRREDRAKDILYMHDTLQIFGARLHDLRELWRRDVAQQLNARKASVVSKASEALFGELTDDARRAALISTTHGLNAEAIRLACQYGFVQVFG